jgi:hypothetical protein
VKRLEPHVLIEGENLPRVYLLPTFHSIDDPPSELSDCAPKNIVAVEP